MSVTQSDLVDAIAKLNDLTRRKTLVWKVQDSPEYGSFGSSYVTEYEGRFLRVAEHDTRTERARALYDHPSSRATASRYVLEIVGRDGNPVYEFPNVQGIADLFASVRAQLADVDGLIKSLLQHP